MEAPDKIYVYIPDDDIVGTASVKKGVPHQFVTEEYTRTDAFIEKACEFINKANLYLYHCISEECDLVDTDKMIGDFKNYMKGE